MPFNSPFVYFRFVRDDFAFRKSRRAKKSPREKCTSKAVMSAASLFTCIDVLFSLLAFLPRKWESHHNIIPCNWIDYSINGRNSQSVVLLVSHTPRTEWSNIFFLIRTRSGTYLLLIWKRSYMVINPFIFSKDWWKSFGLKSTMALARCDRIVCLFIYLLTNDDLSRPEAFFVDRVENRNYGRYIVRSPSINCFGWWFDLLLTPDLH